MAPTPLELARMHEAELKQCFKQYSVVGALVRQIMVGRTVTLAGYPAVERAVVSDIKLQDGKIKVYGKWRGRKRQCHLCDSLRDVTIVENQT